MVLNKSSLKDSKNTGGGGGQGHLNFLQTEGDFLT